MTPTLISGSLAILLYSVLVVMAFLQLKRNQPEANLLKIIGLFAFTCQGFFLFWTIVSNGNQNLNLFNMLALTNWLAIATLLVNSLTRNVTLMLLLVSGLAALSTAASLSFAKAVNWQLGGQWASILHILTAMVATGFMFLAALQALLVAFADRQLRKHPTNFPHYFPPLQSLESFLFQLLMFGFILMSVSLLIAFFYLRESILSQPLHKSVLSSLSWVTFAVLLIGHRTQGWRGATAAKWTLGGFALLSLGYFGSKLVVELILS